MKKSVAIFLTILIFVCATACLAFHAHDAIINWKVFYIESTREGQPLVDFLDDYCFYAIKCTVFAALMLIVDTVSVVFFVNAVKLPCQSRKIQ